MPSHLVVPGVARILLKESRSRPAGPDVPRPRA
jgi:hypothetical protein